MLALARMRRLPRVLSRAEVVVLSLAAALLYALGSVVQHRAAARVHHEHSLRPSLLARLATNPRWLLANAVNLSAFALQFLALRRGSLLVVQPLLVTALLFALPLEAAAAHHRVSGRDWAAGLAVVAGLGAFLAVANPDVGRGTTSGRGWVGVLLAGAGSVGLLVWAATRSDTRHRAAYLGMAAGIVYGLTAAVSRASGTLLGHGVAHALRAWEPYALAGLAVTGLVLSQSAFQAGPLKISLPLFSVVEPVVAAAIGVLAFHEHPMASPAALAAEALAVAVMVTGVVALARSPLVLEARAPV